MVLNQTTVLAQSILDPWSFQTGIFGKSVSLIPFSLVC